MKLVTAPYTDNVASQPRAVTGGSGALMYGGLPFNLQPDEALIIEADPGDASYWSFQPYTYGWFDAGDYANRLVGMNMDQLVQDEDGKFRIVVAHQDPGLHNWIDTEGRQRAIIAHRWMNATRAPEVTAKLVKFEELDNHLPKTSKRVSAVERRQQIAERHKHVQLRFHN